MAAQCCDCQTCTACERGETHAYRFCRRHRDQEYERGRRR